jgi:two-component system cell cycle response regulator
VYAIFVMFAADVAYGILELGDGFVAGGVLDALWLSVSLALGMAALHPSMRALTTEVPVAAPAYGAWRFLLLFSACACAPVLPRNGCAAAWRPRPSTSTAAPC